MSSTETDRRRLRDDWNRAKALHRAYDLAAALRIYRRLESVVERLETVQPRDPATTPARWRHELAFDRAMFFADHAGAECDAGRFAEARQRITRAIKYKGDSYLPFAYQVRGSIAHFAGAHAEGLRWYDKALAEVAGLYANPAISRDGAVILTCRGEALFALGRRADAEASFRDAIRGSKEPFEPYWFLSLICADDGRAKESATWRSQYLTRRKKLTATAFRRRCRFYPAELKKRL